MTDEAVQVETRSGRLRGLSDGRILTFLGIPYAEAPVGSRRWARPRPLRGWSGVRDATDYGPVAPQVSGAPPMRRLAAALGAPLAEDCLYLNIWAPARTEEPLPVMVWLHGGGFFLGAGSRFVYSGDRLARRGAVVVTLNYRLGALGFLDLGSLSGGTAAEAPANLGLHDQIAALRWVRDNITAFGGDPRRITLFGESAGAMCAATLLAAKPELFRRAILQSGAAANFSTRDQAAEVAKLFLEALGVPDGDLRRLRALSLRQLLAAQRSVLGQIGELRRLPWQPSIDDDLITREPLAAIGEGAGEDRDLIVGTTRDEWRLFTAARPSLRWMRRTSLERRVGVELEHLGLNSAGAADLVAAYRRSIDQRRPRPHDLWTAMRTDQIFRLPAVRLADRKASGSGRTFMYRLDFEIPAARRYLRACHGVDLPLVFGTLGHWALKPLYLDRPAALRLAASLQEAWVAFARDGRPRAADLPSWEPYDRESRRTLLLGDPPRVATRPDQARLDLWRRLESSAGAAGVGEPVSSGSGRGARSGSPS